MKKELSKKDQILISGIIGIGIVVVFVFMFVLQPLIKKILDYNHQEKSINEQLAKVESMSADREKLKAELETISQKIEYFEMKLPRETDIPEVLEELIKIGEKSDVIFVMIEPKHTEQITAGEAADKKYLEIPIEIKLRAGYHEFAKFINGVENFQRFMKVDNIKLMSNTEQDKMHEASLTVSAYAIQKDEIEADVK